MSSGSFQQPRRILLKLSGEALQGRGPSGIDLRTLTYIANEIASIITLGVQVGIVIGAGNFVRGMDYLGYVDDTTVVKIDRITADQMGMLATIINGIALRDILNKHHLPTQVMSAWAVQGVVDAYDRFKAIHSLNQGNVLIFVAGTGNPLVTTDTAAALRGIEIQADLLLKATKVDGVFSADPVKHTDAQKYTQLSYAEVLDHRLGVMDLSAIILCQDNKLPLRVFDLNQKNALLQIMQGKDIGTLISQ